MSDYQKALKIQELREQRVELMWMYITTEISVLDGASDDQYIDVRDKVKELDKQIKELQNG